MLLKVLFLDDETELCELFLDQFTAENVQVMTFSDSQKAISASKTQSPNIIFLDYRLRDMTGDLVAQQMPNDIPKYLITGDSAVSSDFEFAGIFPKPGYRQFVQEVIEAKLKDMSATY